MKEYIAYFTAKLDTIEKDAELKDNLSPAFIKEVGAALHLVQGTQAEIELFLAMPKKTAEQLQEKTASVKETRAKARPVKFKLQKQLKALGKLEEEEAGEEKKRVGMVLCACRGLAL